MGKRCVGSLAEFVADIRGVGLVDLLVTISIIAALTGMIMPLFTAVDQFRLEYEASVLYHRLKYVREISTYTDYFKEAEGRTYEPVPRLILEESQHKILLRSGKKLLTSWSYGSDINISCNRAEIMFWPNGEATAGMYTISLGDKQSRVIIDRVGRIRIE
ncbi:MAG: hypothetical protein K6C05_10640 [Anaerovibrio sp.]|uniref:pilus assembly FimT family protein n=1 Tax=Anaerovibrio sp. TaxID=1872532 RepID=UPI0025D510D9|nr:hypothetical protein [Anaerovibrio sp.]MCR5177287.1 hypothetical protein [Anaerovibrio sp.]